jgi:CobQ-like glutamine amidotransferase family enzyme
VTPVGRASESAVRIVVLAHDLLGTYGDLGNGVVLEARLRWRGHPAELIVHEGGGPAPADADVYLLGGGEDAPQSLAFNELSATDALHRAVDGGAVVLGVCAGYQLLGHRFRTTDGRDLPGFGLLDTATVPGGSAPRAVGEIAVEPDASLGLPTLTGFENHAGRTTLGSGAQPLGRVIAGVGNTGADGTEGAFTGHVIGTYLHGPVLVRNPALADLLLSWVVGPLEPLTEPAVETLRRERLAAVTAVSRRRLVRR